MKYYIESVFGNYLTNNLIFSEVFENVMSFDSIEEAKTAIIMYNCDNCIIKHKQ